MTRKQSFWRNRIVDQGEVAAADLVPNPSNWRAHPVFQRSALSGALKEIGWVQQVVVNRTTGHLIDGHLRVDLARELNEKVPVLYVELSEDEERLVLATLDPLSALATADQDALDALLASISTTDESLAALLDKLRVTDADDALIDDDEYEQKAIAFVVEVSVATTADRDRASEALTKIGLTPTVRTVRADA